MPTLALAIDARKAKDGAIQFTIAADQIKKVAGEATSATGQLEASTKSYGQAASQIKSTINGLIAAYAGFATLRSVAREIIQQERAVAQLNAGLKSTKGASGQTIESIMALSKQMQNLTTNSASAVAAASSMLLTFTHINNDIFPATVRAAADISARFGDDLSNTMLIVGKAMDSPAEGLTNLLRIGIRFSDEQEAVIKALMETGKRAEAQRVMLKELEIQFGGSAEAAKNTFGGALASLKNDFAELGQSIGQYAVPTLKEWIQATSGAAKILAGHRDEVTGNVNAANRLAFAIEAVVASLIAYKGAQLAIKTGEFITQLLALEGAFTRVKIAALATNAAYGAAALAIGYDVVIIIDHINQLNDALDNAYRAEDRQKEIREKIVEQIKESSRIKNYEIEIQKKLNQQIEAANELDWSKWFKKPSGMMESIHSFDELSEKITEIDKRLKAAGEDYQKITVVAQEFNNLIYKHGETIKALPGGEQLILNMALVISPIQQAAWKKLKDDIQSHFDDVEFEISIQGKTPEEAEIARKLREIKPIIEKAYGAGSERSAEKMLEYEQKLNQLVSSDPELAHKRAQATAEMYSQMQNYGEEYYQSQKELINLQYTEYAKYINNKALLDEWYKNQLIKLSMEISPIWQETKRVIGDTQNALSDFFMNMEGGFDDFVNSVLKSVQRMFANLAAQAVMYAALSPLGLAGPMGVQNPFAGIGSSLLGGLFGGMFGGAGVNAASPTALSNVQGFSQMGYEKGGIFVHGNVITFAGGDVFDKPTYFPMSGGRTGLMGESGPEAVMPLARGSDGRLGVKAESPTVINDNKLKVVNIIDKSVIGDYMSSLDGERVVINIIKRNKGLF